MLIDYFLEKVKRIIRHWTYLTKMADDNMENMLKK